MPILNKKDDSPILRVILRNPVFANILMLAFLFCGLLGATTMVRESFPSFKLDFVNVSVAYPGADPEEVEEGISRPIEEALQGISGIKRITTVANENFGTAAVELDPRANADDVTDRIRNNIQAIRTFPREAEQPIINSFELEDAVLNIAIWGNVSEHELKDLGRKVRDEVRELPGISRVTLSGVREAQISVDVSDAALKKYGISFDQVAAAVSRSSLNTPGGSIRTTQEELRIRILGRKYRAREFGPIIVRALPDGSSITLDDVAVVNDTFNDDSSTYSLFNGSPAVQINILKTEKEDAIKIAESVRAYVDERQAGLPDSVNLSIWLDSSRLIQDRINLLLRNGAIGLCLVFLSLWLFMDLRLSFWVTAGIPISFGGALALMALTGQSLNMISLFGLIMVLGIIVDDAIVVGESIYDLREQGVAPREAAVFGTRKVVWPVITAITTTIVAFSPLFFLPGITGKFIAVLPGPVTAALFISLFEALLILPVHMRHLPMPKVNKKNPAWWIRSVFAGGLIVVIDRIFRPILRFSLRWRYAAVAASFSLILIISGLMQSGIIKQEFFPQADGDFIRCRFEMPPGTPVDRTGEVAKQIRDAWQRTETHFAPRLNGQSLTAAFNANVGGTLGFGEEPRFGDYIADVFVELLPTEQRNILAQDVIDHWREETGPIPDTTVLSFAAFSGGPPKAAIQLDLLGHDQEKLLTASRALKQRLQEFEGVFDIESSYRPGKRELRISLRPAAESLGLTLADVGNQLRSGFYGQEIMRVQRGIEEVKIVVRYPEDERAQLGQLENLRIRTPNGTEVPLATVADVNYAAGYATIRREQNRRSISITADTAEGVNGDEITNQLLASFLPKLSGEYGVIAKRGFDAEDRVKLRQSVSKLGAIAILIIYLLMATVFKSYVQPLVIMFAIPFGFVGAAIGHYVYNIPMSMMSLFGLVALTGIVVNDAIVLIAAINDRIAGGEEFFRAVSEGAVRRFRAIVLTSLTTFAGLFPMILERSFQAQILIPMAISIAFGVLFATIGTLLVIPCLLGILNDVRCGTFSIWNLRTPQTRNDVESATPEKE